MKYTIHDPNNPEILAKNLIKLFVEVNTPKVEALIREEDNENLEKTTSA